MIEANGKAQASGAAKLRQRGGKAILVDMTAEQHATIKQAAKADRRSMRQFILHHILPIATTLLAKRAS